MEQERGFGMYSVYACVLKCKNCLYIVLVVTTNDTPIEKHGYNV